jgi:hypothetical protein
MKQGVFPVMYEISVFHTAISPFESSFGDLSVFRAAINEI